MKLIVGLGNPGKQYDNTRHNIGFSVIDKLCSELNISLDQKKFNTLFYKGIINNQKVIIAQPQTFMNLSGEAVAQIIKFYDIQLENIIIIYDDMDTPFAQFKIRQKGGAGGQNGMKSIINHLHTQTFPRIKMGIGKHEFIKGPDYVLGKFTANETKELNNVINNVAKACLAFIDNDVNYIMNNYNKKV